MTRGMNENFQGALHSCRRHFKAALGFSALVNLLFVVPMLYMLQVYERVVPTRGATTLAMLTLVLVLGLLTMAVLDSLRARLLVRAGVRLDADLSQTICDVTLAGNDKVDPRLSRQAMRDFDTLRQAMTGPAILALLDAPWVPIYVLFALLIHPWIAVLCVVGAAAVIVLAIRNEKVSAERLMRANLAAGQAYAEFDETVGASDIVRALGMRRALVAELLAKRRTMMALQTEASLASSGVVATSKFVRQLLQSLALGVGALLAIRGSISPGAIFASMFIVGRALAPIDQIIGNWRSILQARGAWQSLNRLLDQRPEPVERTHLPKPTGRIAVEGLSILSDDGTPIIQDISFDVPAGKVVAIVGPSGAGKSTLVRAMAGALLPSEGTIRFDGADQRNWDPELLAEHIGFMPQESHLFSGTLKENIARFRNRLGEDAARVDADVVAAAQAAGAHDLIQQLPDGYDLQVGVGGRGLSAGQKQRIALARAMFRKPSTLILDEPNSNLDADGDRHLMQCLDQARQGGATVFLVAHRMSMMPIVDYLLVIQDGRVAAFGSRDEVMSRMSAHRAPAVGTTRPRAA